MAIVEVINFIFASILIIFNFSMFQVMKKYKAIRSEEENLFLIKSCSTSICFTYFCFMLILIVLDICPNDRTKPIYLIQEYLFNVYIVLIYAINLFISLEMFFTYKNPIHYYLVILKKKSRKLYEIILCISALFILCLNILDPFGDKDKFKIKKEEKNKNYSTPFFIMDSWKWAILLSTNIAAIVFNYKLLFLISNFYFEKKDKLKNVIKKKLISNFFYFVYAFYNLIIFGILKDKSSGDYKQNLIFIIAGSFIIFIVLISETAIDLFLLSTTKFSQYKLRKTFVGFFTYLFPSDFEENIDMVEPIKIPKKKIIGSDDDDEEEEEEEGEEEKEVSENEDDISLEPRTPEDTELVSIFKNNIFFEDYFMSFCDQYLNILTASLFKMYNSKLFSIKSVENKKIKEEMGGESISGIGGIGNASSTQEISATVRETDNSSSYTFYKKKGKNHFAIFKKILGKSTEDIKVKITSYYTDNCVMNIKKINLISKKIASSIISHFIISPKKEDKDNKEKQKNNCYSLLSANAKEEYFRNMKNISFKSYDKNFNIDFFETDDEAISEKNESNKNIANMINQYFNYIQNKKGKTGTFLPELIGIFKIKINDFRTMLIYISRNSIIHNVPRNFYNYWQLLRFDRQKPEKVATSKYHRGTLIKEVSLFERLYASDVKKDKNMNKVMLRNYTDFKEIIENDIQFLKENNLLNVNLLMMYFEYENTQKHEKEGAIKIRKTDANEAEIINVDLPDEENKDKTKTENKEEEKEIKEEKEEKEKEKGEEKKENEVKEKSETINENSDNILKINDNNINEENKNDENINNDLDEKLIDEDFEKDEKDDDIFGDEGFDFMPDLGKEAHNLVDYIEKVNISGYDGNFDNFICMCFFTFENAFDINNKSENISDEIFKNKILENFSEFKSKE